MTSGYLYYADSENYLSEAIQSATRLEQVQPNAKISVISPGEAPPPFEMRIPIGQQIEDKTLLKDPEDVKGAWKLSLLRRIDSLLLTPYDRTLYLDSDTYAVESPKEVFQLLDYFDICMAKAPLDRSAVQINSTELTCAEPHNCGVILFKKNQRVCELFGAWKEYFSEQLKNGNPGADQAAFEQALIESDVRIYTLSNLWNARARYPLSLLGSVKILHVRSNCYPKLALSINISKGLRIWNPVQKSCSVLTNLRG